MRTLGIEPSQDISEKQAVDHRSPATKGAIAEEGLHGDKDILMAGTIVASQAQKRQAGGKRAKREASGQMVGARLYGSGHYDTRVNGLQKTDAFFELIAAEIAPRLAADPPTPLSHWMIISDAQGVTTCRLDAETEGMEVDAILRSHIDGGAYAAAFLTARSDFVLAQVLISAPRNSDLRRASLAGLSGEARLSPWVPEL